MSKTNSPYKHPDGSNCWTKNCSLGSLKESKNNIINDKENFMKEWFLAIKNEDKVYIDTIATQEEFNLAVANGDVSRQTHPIYPYSIYKYSQATNFKKNWNNITMASRGLVVNDETGEIMARPFSKFFNYNEPSAPIELMRGEIRVSEKIDGSLAISIQTPDGLLITTSGGFSSEQAAHANQVYKEKYEGKWKLRPHTTYMWEIIYPENRIVIDYGDEDDLYLLGAVNIHNGKSIPLSELKEWKWKRTNEHNGYKSLDTVTSSGERSNHEGYVIHYIETDVRVKYKHDEYVRHHRYATGINSRRIWEMMRDGEDMESWLAVAPEEFEDYITTTKNSVQSNYDTKINEINSTYSDFIKTLHSDISKKDFALAAKANVPTHLISYMFSLHERGDIGSSGIRKVWESIKPNFEKSSWATNSGKTTTE